MRCNNCGDKNHEYKNCPLPVTSIGIILMYINKDIRDKFNFAASITENIQTSDTYYLSRKECGNIEVILNNVKLLLASRKYSIGYIEFVRGRYKVQMIEQTIYLFRQMTQNEINKIAEYEKRDDGFECMWNDVWGDHLNKRQIIEKRESRKKYEMLKHNGKCSMLQPGDTHNAIDIDLGFIVKHVRPDHDTVEWGFPKGRRNFCETDRECAIREFMEETGFGENQFKIIDGIQPLRETFIGTNGIKYCHIYYVAELIDDSPPKNIKDNEIGDIVFVDCKTALESIREYHQERKNIIRCIFLYLTKKYNERN